MNETTDRHSNQTWVWFIVICLCVCIKFPPLFGAAIGICFGWFTIYLFWKFFGGN